MCAELSLGAASIAGVVATATRAVGLVLIPALLIEAMKEGDPSKRARRIVGALVPAAGFIAYLAFWLIRSGDPLLPLQAPALWQRTAQIPFLMVGWRSLRVSYVVYAACTFAILFTFAYSPRPFLGIQRYER